MRGKYFAIAALLLIPAGLWPVDRASADDPITLSAERGREIAALLRAHGAICLQATTLKRTIVRLDGQRSYRVACGPDGAAPIYLVTLPPGQLLGSASAVSGQSSPPPVRGRGGRHAAR